MNIFELSEKNLNDAVALYRNTTEKYLEYLSDHPLTDDEIGKMLMEYELRGDFTYVFYDRGNAIAMVSICKSSAEIANLHVNFDAVDPHFPDKFLEFVVKQFSTIVRVFTTVVSCDTKAVDLLEKYGFEYTGEQEYISKEKNVLRYRYVYKRKK